MKFSEKPKILFVAAVCLLSLSLGTTLVAGIGSGCCSDSPFAATWTSNAISEVVLRPTALLTLIPNNQIVAFNTTGGNPQNLSCSACTAFVADNSTIVALNGTTSLSTFQRNPSTSVWTLTSSQATSAIASPMAINDQFVIATDGTHPMLQIFQRTPGLATLTSFQNISLAATPVSVSVSQLSCQTPSLVASFGNASVVAVYFWNGTQYNFAQSLQQNATLTAVTCTQLAIVVVNTTLVYTWNFTSPTLLPVPDDTSGSDLCGSSLAMSCETLLVGCPGFGTGGRTLRYQLRGVGGQTWSLARAYCGAGGNFVSTSTNVAASANTLAVSLFAAPTCTAGGVAACVNGTCVPSWNFGTVDTFNCTCSAGFVVNSGGTCTFVDNCASAPCLHGGTCVAAINGFGCICPNVWSGATCQTRIIPDNCASAPCMNGATCTSVGPSYFCTCVAGFSGTNCQISPNPCISVPCTNGGTCINSTSTNFTCQCVAGYSGIFCETTIDFCASTPCQNGGTCITSVNSYTCSCASGFSGVQCATVTPPSSSSSSSSSVLVPVFASIGSFLVVALIAGLIYYYSPEGPGVAKPSPELVGGEYGGEEPSCWQKARQCHCFRGRPASDVPAALPKEWFPGPTRGPGPDIWMK